MCTSLLVPLLCERPSTAKSSVTDWCMYRLDRNSTENLYSRECAEYKGKCMTFLKTHFHIFRRII